MPAGHDTPAPDVERIPEPLRRIAATLLGAPGTRWSLGGSAALVAFGLLERPIRDLDLCHDGAISPAVLDPTVAAARREGWAVEVVRPGPDDLRLVVDGEVGVDLAPHRRFAPTVPSDVGPLRHPEDLLGDKAEAFLRFASTKHARDLRHLARRWPRDELVALGVRKGTVRPGNVPVACQLAVEWARREDVPELDDAAWEELLEFYADWRAELSGPEHQTTVAARPSSKPT